MNKWASLFMKLKTKFVIVLFPNSHYFSYIKKKKNSFKFLTYNVIFNLLNTHYKFTCMMNDAHA